MAETLRISESKVSRALALLKYPEIETLVESGKLSARTANEIAKLDNKNIRMKLADSAVETGLTHKHVAKLVRQRKGAAKHKSAKKKLTFPTENQLTVLVIGNSAITYDDVEQALSQALDEVRHRIKNNVQVF